jgi:hypothetical protein
VRIPLAEAEPVTLEGIEALYQPHEMSLLRGILLRYDSGGYGPGAAARELRLLHGCKAMLGATVLAENDPWRGHPPALVDLPDHSPMTGQTLSSAA